jgi:hypothetical protein
MSGGPDVPGRVSESVRFSDTPRVFSGLCSAARRLPYRGGMHENVITPLETRLAEHPDPADHWLWCFLCERFFHLDAARRRPADEPRCPFSDCYGYGYDFYLHFWDSARVPEDPRWPKTAAELHHGMRSPDYESFAQERLEARMASLLTAFGASPECRARLGEPPRYVRAFLQMMSDLCCDLTDPAESSFSDLSAPELLPDLPVWARTADLEEADRMVVELIALFEFGARTGSISDAHAWHELIADDTGLPEIFRRTMRTDARLRKLRPPRKRERPPRHKRGERIRTRSKRRSAARTCNPPADS